MNPRITTGNYKNKRLTVPKSARPVTERMKRSIFDTLSASLNITELKFADLFAGTGSLGIEALSRGAKHVTFVDNDSEAISLLRSNLERLDVEKERYKIKKAYFKTFANNYPEQFDVFFIDPPFHAIERVRFEKIKRLMHSESIAILKCPDWYIKKFREKYKDTFEIVYANSIGKNGLVYFRKIS